MKRENISLLQVLVRCNPQDLLALRSNHTLCERIAESTEFGLDSANPSSSTLFDFFRKRAAPPAPLPLRAKSCRFSLLGGEPRLSASSKKSAVALLQPCSRFFAPRSGRDSRCALTRGLFLTAKFCGFAEFSKIISRTQVHTLTKFLLLFAFVKRRIPSYPKDSNPPSKVDYNADSAIRRI